MKKIIEADLPIVFDDKLGRRKKAAGKGLWLATGVPSPEGKPWIRRKVRKNAFDFQYLITRVPLVSSSTSWWPFGGKKAKYASCNMISYKLNEGDQHWSMSVRWEVEGQDSEIDLAAFKKSLSDQLSDGWGEGVEQLCFGPLVVCEDDEKRCRLATRAEQGNMDPFVDGRYSFNLTTIGATIWTFFEKSGPFSKKAPPKST